MANYDEETLRLAFKSGAIAVKEEGEIDHDDLEQKFLDWYRGIKPLLDITSNRV